MAEVLFLFRDGGPGGYKLGDVVAIKEDGYLWALLETRSAWIAAGRIGAEWNADFFLVKIPGVSVATVEYLLEEFPAGTLGQGRRRLWRFVTGELTAGQLNTLQNLGEYTVGVALTKAQTTARLRRKDTEAQAVW